MREILFRGKSVNTGEWVFGVPVKVSENGEERIDIVSKVIDDFDYYMPYVEREDVLPETVGQYTGLDDKDGTKIFEGDIIENGETYLVKWVTNECCFQLKVIGRFQWGSLGDGLSNVEAEEAKVIGNIYDNPELLKGE